jgi:hypothetical protein
MIKNHVKQNLGVIRVTGAIARDIKLWNDYNA